MLGVCGGKGSDCFSEERYLKKLMPVPGTVKEAQSAPLGDLPRRNPARPQLTPTPRDVTVVLAPPPRFIDLRQRQPIKTLPLQRFDGCLIHVDMIANTVEFWYLESIQEE